MSDELISIRKYAESKGVSHVRVIKAIQEGKIVKGVVVDDKGKKKINPAVADAEWREHFNPTKNTNPALLMTLGVAPNDGEDKSNAVLQQAKVATIVYNAKKSELQYKREIGELVEREKVDKALFVVGKQLREALQRIPDRIIDELLSAPTRNDAHRILYDELEKILTEYSDLDKTLKI